MIIVLTEHYLYVRNCEEFFTFFFSFNLSNSPEKMTLLAYIRDEETENPSQSDPRPCSSIKNTREEGQV